MLPVIVLVGRPNVGKSTLFNQLTRSRDALVAAVAGLTRDRKYGFGRVGAIPYLAVDTGGLSGNTDGLDGLVARQTLRAVAEADRVLFMVDAREGLTTADEHVADALRSTGRPVRVVVNKAEGQRSELAVAEFHSLGFGEPTPISSAHGDNIGELMQDVLAGLESDVATAPAGEESDRIRVAVIGRPNVGKSTLVNRLLGDERVVASAQPGTTRDAIEIPFDGPTGRFLLIDTAGVRRRARVQEAIEKFSVIKALQAVDRAHVVIAVLDARDTIAEQDASLLGLVVERGRALVIALNKWDGLDADQRQRIRREVDLRLPFVDFARLHTISALHGSGVGDLLPSAAHAYAAALRDLPTPELTRALQEAINRHQPPLVRGRRIKLRYAHQGGKNPPVIVVHGNQTRRVPEAYRRFLVNTFRERFELAGTPVRVEFRTDENPYAGPPRRRPRKAT